MKISVANFLVFVFAFVHFLPCFMCTKASAITTQSITIEGESYEISNETPYIVVVPETLKVGNSDKVYLGGLIDGEVTLSIPDSVTLSQVGKPNNKLDCNLVMGKDNKLLLNTTDQVNIQSVDILTSFSDKTPLLGEWIGTFSYSLSEDIVKDVTEYLEYTLSDDSTYYIISGVKDTSVFDYCKNKFVLPSEYNGKPIKAIGDDAFKASYSSDLGQVVYQKRSIKVIIPETIEVIGDSAFKYFGGEGTEFVFEGNGLKTIGAGAFNNSCVSSVTLPNSVIEIGYQAFYYCQKLVNINIPTSLKTLGAYAFSQCVSLESDIILPSSLTEIGTGVFSYCSSLKTVYWNCCNITSIPNRICKTAKCLENFIISRDSETTLTEIGSYAFHECSALTAFNFPSTLSKISNYAFYSSGLTSATYPATATVYSKSFPSDCDIITV